MSLQLSPTGPAERSRGVPGRAWWRLVAGRWGIVLVGVGLEAVYLLVLGSMRIWSRAPSPNTNLVRTFELGQTGALHYVAVVGALFALYVLALWLVKNLSLGSVEVCKDAWIPADGPKQGKGLDAARSDVGATRRVAPTPPPRDGEGADGRGRFLFCVGMAAMFCGTLVLTHPLSSGDVFSYVASARVQWVYGDNPLVTPPLAHPYDPATRLLVFWRELPSPYGPLWSLITWVPYTIGRGHLVATLVAFKAMSALFFLAAALLAAATAERLRRGWAIVAFVALAWNPLAVWETAGNGHNDAVMVCLLALAAYLLVRGVPGPAMLAFTASALVKFPSLLLVPAILLWWWKSGQQPSPRRLAPWLAASAVLAAAAYAPYWHGLSTFHASLNEGNYFGVSGQAALRGALLHVLSAATAGTVTTWTGRAAFLAVYVVLLWRMRRGSAANLLATGALAFVVFLLLGAPYFGPWYVLWPLTLAAMVPWRREALVPVAALSLGAMGVLLWATWVRVHFDPHWSADWYPMHPLSFAGAALPTAAAWWWARERGGHTADTGVIPVMERVDGG